MHRAAHAVRDHGLGLLGGRCRLLLCGAGAMDPATLEFFRSACAITFLELYGCTECGNLARDRMLLPHVEFRLLSVDAVNSAPVDSVAAGASDGGDAAEGSGEGAAGTGELAVRTGPIAGYYRDAARTDAAFTPDGYYRNGDIVRVTPAETGLRRGGGRARGVRAQARLRLLGFP